VASHLGALPEILTEGENGFTFDPTRPGDLALILRRLVYEENLMARLREGVLRTPVVTMFDHAEIINSVYQEAMADLCRHSQLRAADLSELRFFHGALLKLGFNAAP
jgi:glycosyltransferase involved in cell wall biosynthesis